MNPYGISIEYQNGNIIDRFSTPFTPIYSIGEKLEVVKPGKRSLYRIVDIIHRTDPEGFYWTVTVIVKFEKEL